MSRLVDRWLTAIYVALAALPLIAMLAGWRGRTLHGALAPKPQPTLTLTAVLAEKFQHGLVEWFESNLGMKGTSIGIDNAILYYGFRETKQWSPVKIGDEGVLFIDEDIGYFSKHGANLPTPAYVDTLVTQIAELQQRFRAEGRAFVPLIAPAKSSIWRDHMPERWTMDVGDPPPSDTHVYEAFKAALDRHGVRYVDARATFTSSLMPRELLWGRDARHWSSYGACIAMREVLKVQAELLGKPALPMACELTLAIGRRRSNDDYDLWRLLNAYGVPPSVRSVPTVVHATPLPGPKPSLLFIGTSFCWQIMRQATNSQLFGRTHMNYYNQTFVPWPDGDQFPVRANTPEWRDVVLGNDLYVLDLFESYLGAPGAYVELFLNDLRAELARAK